MKVSELFVLIFVAVVAALSGPPDDLIRVCFVAFVIAGGSVCLVLTAKTIVHIWRGYRTFADWQCLAICIMAIFLYYFLYMYVSK